MINRLKQWSYWGMLLGLLPFLYNLKWARVFDNVYFAMFGFVVFCALIHVSCLLLAKEEKIVVEKWNDLPSCHTVTLEAPKPPTEVKRKVFGNVKNKLYHYDNEDMKNLLDEETGYGKQRRKKTPKKKPSQARKGRKKKAG